MVAQKEVPSVGGGGGGRSKLGGSALAPGHFCRRLASWWRDSDVDGRALSALAAAASENPGHHRQCWPLHFVLELKGKKPPPPPPPRRKRNRSESTELGGRAMRSLDRFLVSVRSRGAQSA